MMDNPMVREVFGARPACAIDHAFNCMAIAEKEIEAAIERWPIKATALDAAFGLACPSEALARCPARVYRAHMRSLLEAVAEGGDTRAPTAAEMLMVVMRTTLKTPVSPEFQALYARLFLETFGEEHAEIVGDLAEPSTHVHEQGVDDLRVGLERQLRVADRRL